MLALSVGPPASASPPAEPGDPAGSYPAGNLEPDGQQRQPEQTVTLITGDRVTVRNGGGVTVTPRPGVTYLQRQVADHHYVIPSDAMPLLASDRLDRRLFDVTTLSAAGDQEGNLPVIVSEARRAPAGVTAARELPAVDAMVAELPTADLAETWDSMKSQGLGRSPGYEKIWLDGLRQPALDVSVPKVGAPQAWASGWDGTGVTVAVLDTGIDAAHPDLAGRVEAAENFTDEGPLDLVGHGTHVASTIAGSGAASDGRYRGVAPGASLLDGKVCADRGCRDSWVLAGMQWAADNGAQVVNMSLGGPDFAGVDPLEQAVEDLTASHGILFVVAAGNDGVFGAGSVSSPATADAALAVGSVDRDDLVARSSGRGPRTGDLALKPDITAPGVGIVAARSRDGRLGTQGESYVALSGTSMATPHVAGAAAILTQQHPEQTPGQRKAALMATAAPNPTDGLFAQGAGRLDVARATAQAVTSSPASVSLGRQSFPHQDDQPDARTLTYHNNGDADVTLQLSVDTSAPEEMFHLSESSVTVPAGGEASVTFTSDTRQGGETYGYLGGWVVASAGDLRVRTAFAVDREHPHYTVDLTIVGRDGQPGQSSSVFLTDLGAPFPGGNYGGFGTDQMQLRVPPGDYVLEGFVDTPAEQHSSLFYQPVLQVRDDLTMTLDAREAHTYEVTVPDQAAAPAMFVLSTNYNEDGNVIVTSLAGATPSQVSSLQLGPAHVDNLTGFAETAFARPGADRDFFDSEVVFQGSWRRDGALFDGFVKRLTRADFARIVQDFRAQAGRSARHIVGAVYPEIIGATRALDSRLPFRRTLYLAGDGTWEQTIYENTTEQPEEASVIARLQQQGKVYRPGQRLVENWNHPVQGPAFPAGRSFPFLARNLDSLTVEVPHFSDSAGHWDRGFQTSAGHTTLFRDGELVGSFDGVIGFLEMSPDPARYRLEATMERRAPFTTSTRVNTVWEFESARGDGTVHMPVTAFGFAPKLDQHNTARPHRVMPVPVTVYQQGDAQPLRELTILASTDDGGSWQEVPVITTPRGHLALVTNPATAGHVSLRAQATDRDGNTVDQTIIRAYAVR